MRLIVPSHFGRRRQRPPLHPLSRCFSFHLMPWIAQIEIAEPTTFFSWRVIVKISVHGLIITAYLRLTSLTSIIVIGGIGACGRGLATASGLQEQFWVQDQRSCCAFALRTAMIHVVPPALAHTW